ncbi:MAG TPA: hypothetical protein VF101_00950 [Gaiellaceae bacterium]
MNEGFRRAETENDPFSVTERGAFGPYSALLRADPRAKVQKVVSAQARPLTRATLLAYDDADNFYAPLISVLDADAGRPFALGEARVLLTDPPGFGDSIENWERAGFAIPSLRTYVISSDEEFDTFVVDASSNGEGVVIDPLLSTAGKPVAGFVVSDLQAELARARATP